MVGTLGDVRSRHSPPRHAAFARKPRLQMRPPTGRPPGKFRYPELTTGHPNHGNRAPRRRERPPRPPSPAKVQVAHARVPETPRAPERARELGRRPQTERAPCSRRQIRVRSGPGTRPHAHRQRPPDPASSRSLSGGTREDVLAGEPRRRRPLLPGARRSRPRPSPDPAQQDVRRPLADAQDRRASAEARSSPPSGDVPRLVASLSPLAFPDPRYLRRGALVVPHTGFCLGGRRGVRICSPIVRETGP